MNVPPRTPPDEITCPTCKAPPNHPCTRINGAPIEHYHWLREHPAP